MGCRQAAGATLCLQPQSRRRQCAEPAAAPPCAPRPRAGRQLCNVGAARADLETVTRMKPGHKAAVKELEALAQLEAALAKLDGLGEGAPADGARAAIAEVLGAAPDCTRAQAAEAELEFDAKNYEQARGGGGEGMGVGG
jgi:hypothetical protein